MTDAQRGQVIQSAAEVYEEFFVPALFGQWPPQMLDAAGVSEGDRVLDVGCGTGVLARAAVQRVGKRGRVAGVDPNDGMLAVARRLGPKVAWKNGVAEHLPYPDASFDHVVSQFALMFFADPHAALAEMARVLSPGRSVAIATWASLDTTPGYAAMVELLGELFGNDAADALRAPFLLGEPERVRELVATAFPNPVVLTRDGTARFESIEAWVHTDVRGWTLAGMINDDEYEELLRQATRRLTRFSDAHGRVVFPAPALITTAGT
ncbi:MAG: methyltransferase domain-containing protein [Acidimicrobiia bacterium]|nr:methyltransferase domain-containing protein [Acidimicrobiia bacterium]